MVPNDPNPNNNMFYGNSGNCGSGNSNFLQNIKTEIDILVENNYSTHIFTPRKYLGKILKLF